MAAGAKIGTSEIAMLQERINSITVGYITHLVRT